MAPPVLTAKGEEEWQTLRYHVEWSKGFVLVFLFTHPILQVLARTKFFGQGHRLSGFSPEQLGRPVAYAGRGRVRPPAEREEAAKKGRMTIAERKAAAAAAAERAEKDTGTGTEAGGTEPESTDDAGRVSVSKEK